MRCAAVQEKRVSLRSVGRIAARRSQGVSKIHPPFRFWAIAVTPMLGTRQQTTADIAIEIKNRGDIGDDPAFSLTGKSAQVTPLAGRHMRESTRLLTCANI